MVPWYNLSMVHEDMMKVTSNQEKYPDPPAEKNVIKFPESMLDASADVPVFTKEQLKAKKDQQYVALGGVIFDTAKWQRRHPGGAGIIQKFAGGDITRAYMQQHQTLSIALAEMDAGLSPVGILAWYPSWYAF